MKDLRGEQQKKLVELLGGHVRLEEPMSRHSSLRIGGPALAWAEVATKGELESVLRMARELGTQVVVNGLGSNTLFPDEGIDGFVIRLSGDLATWEVHDGTVEVGAGTVNAHLVRGLLKEGWVGMEFLTLIPGTFGGAIAMNAGTRETELSTILRQVELMLPDEPRMVTMTPTELNMSYRHCALPTGAVVVAGTIEVQEGDVSQAQAAMKADKDRRNLTQPYRLASAGSTFANPEGDAAGRLIEAVGLKGFGIGGARISELHANFFINEGDASADDFLKLMATARVRVRNEFGIELKPEVQFVGFDGWTRLKQLEEEVEC